MERTIKQEYHQFTKDSRLWQNSNSHLKPLSSRQLTVVLHELRGWSQQEGKLHRQFHFSSFEKALGFLSGLALVAEAMGHPAEESNIYDCVTVDLNTPEVGGITNLDVELAQKANELAGCLQGN